MKACYYSRTPVQSLSSANVRVITRNKYWERAAEPARKSDKLNLLPAAVAATTPAPADLQTCSNFKQGARIAYCDSQPGEGYSPEAPDVVVIDYTARAVKSGSVYDGSRQFKFTLGNGEVIVAILWCLHGKNKCICCRRV